MNNEQKYSPNDKEKKLCEWVHNKFKQAYVSKSPLMKEWKKYMDAYEGTYFEDKSRPEYKSNEISNMVFSTIETIRPIMTDNNPKFIAVPNTPNGMDYTTDVQMALDYEWDREKMPLKLPASLITMLVYGTSVWFVPWNGREGEYGEINIKYLDPFNIFPDPLANTVEDAEFIVYATYKNANEIKQQFPKKASAIEGSRISMSELVANRDENDSNEQNQVLVLEMWCRDWTSVDEVEGEKKLRYPGGRVITCLPDLGIILDDKKNPYKDGKFPFVLMKCYDVPHKFWGVGEVQQILSPQHYINELTNQIIDNAKATANMQWIIDKNSGIGQGKLTNRPGLVIRKNPGTEVRRDAPQPMPSYVREQIEILKSDIQDISGVFDSLKGERQGSVTAGSAIMALQEASQSRIRLKIKLMESFLSELAKMVYSRMQQFWKLDRWVRVTDMEGNPSFKEIGQQILSNDFDLKVIAGSTMPVNKNAMLDLMIRLAQTNGEDGMPLVDRKAVLEFLPINDKKAIMDRYEEQKAQQEQQAQQQAQQEQQAVAQQQQMQMQEKQEERAFKLQEKQQQQGELDQNVANQVMGMLQGLMQVSEETGKEVDKLKADKEAREKKENESKIEEKGFKRGVSEGKKQAKQEVGDKSEGNINISESNNVSGIANANMPMDKQEVEGIPTEVLEELLTLAQSNPKQLMEIIQAYPELGEMLQQEFKNMEGGM